MATGIEDIDHTRCGYCWVVFDSMMSDPRELPCKHVCCISCVQEDYKERNGVLCPNCTIFHQILDVPSLPRVNLVSPQASSTASNLTCDRKGCTDKAAVCFCISCEAKLCDTHQQAHKAYYSDEHDIVTIQVYERSPEKYTKMYCERHTTEVLVRACKKCDQLACIECETSEEDCPGDGERHKFSTFAAMAEEITSYYKQLLKFAEDKITEMCKVSKQAWRLLDDKEIKCNTWIEEITLIREEQIRVLREESDKIIQKVKDHQKEMTNQIEAFDAELIAKKEQLEGVRTRLHRLIRNGHVAEKIKQKHEMTAELSKNLDVEVNSCELKAMHELISISAKPTSMKVDFINIPTSLVLSSELDLDSASYSAYHRGNGDLLLGCADGVWYLVKATMTLRKCEQLPFQFVSSIIEHHNVIYLLHKDKETQTCKVEMCLPELTKTQTVFDFPNNSPNLATMSVSDKYIVAFLFPQPNPRQLIIYDLDSKTTTTTEVATPHAPYFLPDGNLITVGVGEITKHSIEDGKLTPIWTCKELSRIWGVCTNSNQLLFVSTHSEKRSIYVISPEGLLLKELSGNMLPTDMGDMSIKGDELAVPSWHDRKLYLYVSTYK